MPWTRSLASLALALLPLSLSLAPVANGEEIQLSQYLPTGVEYDPAIPTPASVLGFEVGERHVRPDQLVRYMEVLAASSDRVTLEVTGQTHERRPLLLLTITSPGNHSRLEAIRAAHLALSDPAKPMPSDDALAAMPAVVYLGYSIHGNEASGSNASLAVAYALAAVQGAEPEALLDEVVVLLDPSLNPDGLGRFAHWVNTNRGEIAVADPEHREHREPWPGGRTNHYWFDLNRDWLLLQHPESRARIESFHRWRPNLLGDYHEMGTDSTFFFQPGIPSRQNPLIPESTLALTRKVAQFHAAALNRAGRLYYTEESFDDFYPGKGSTYPDLQGTIGILFEQASARGHVQESDNGPLAFPFAIQNHVFASHSMLQAARELRAELLRHQATLARSGLEAAAADTTTAYVFTFPNDPARARLLLDVLFRHRIRVHALARAVEVGGERFEPGVSYAVPLAQPQYRLVRALFESRTEFEDSTFYDVSAWGFFQAYGAVYGEIRGEIGRRGFSPQLLGELVDAEDLALPAGRLPGGAVVYGYLFDWDGFYAPRALHRLQAAGARAYVATVPFEALTDRGQRAFREGTIFVPAGAWEAPSGEVLNGVLGEISREDGIDVYAASTGLTPEGVDLGSPRVRPLKTPTIALVSGEGMASYAAGELWHLLDYRMGIPVSLVDAGRLGSAPGAAGLNRYTHLVLVDGDLKGWDEKFQGKLKSWVEEGGTLIAVQRSAQWVGSTLLAPPKKPEEEGAKPAAVPPAKAEEEQSTEKAAEEAPEAPRPRYADYEQERAQQLVSGVILQGVLDRTHPVAFGFPRDEIALFRNNTVFLEASENPYENVVLYSETPLLSGYISPEKLAKMEGKAAVVARRLGRGTVVQFAENPSFRGYWHGTQKLFLNALFFGPTIQRTQAPAKWE